MSSSTVADRLWFFLTCPRKTGTGIDTTPWNCGNEGDEGIRDLPQWRDWSDRDSSHDQKRIEATLLEMVQPNSTLLHVGIGNSQFAVKFCPHAKAVDGITVQKGELEKGRALAIPNYRIFLLNKYGSMLAVTLKGQYDFIIDNNPTYFACCRKHFFRMMWNYRKMLRPGGIIMTDRVGLNFPSWTVDPRWRTEIEEWIKIGEKFELSPVQFNQNVHGLKRSS